MGMGRTRGLETAGVALAVAGAAVAAVAPAWGWAACVAAVAGVALTLVGARRGLRRLPAWGAVVVLLAMSGVSLWVTQTPTETWGRTWQLWTGLGMFWALAVWARTRARIVTVGAGLAGAGAALALASPFIVGWFTARKTFFPASVYAAFPRLVSDTVHPNVMAAALLCAVFIAMAWAFRPPKVPEAGAFLGRLAGARGTWVAGGLLMLLVLFLTKSRGAYAAFPVGLAALAFLAARRRAVLAGAVAIVLALAAGGSLWLLQQGAPEWLEDVGGLDTSTLAFRLRVWHYALMLVGDFPLTGVGMGGFNSALRDLYGYSMFRQPGAHSLYLQAALDLGAPGLVALLALVATALWRAVVALRQLRSAGDGLWALAAGGIASLAALLAHGSVDLAVWGTRGAFMLWGLLALLYGLGGMGRQTDGAELAADGGRSRMSAS